MTLDLFARHLSRLRHRVGSGLVSLTFVGMLALVVMGANAQEPTPAAELESLIATLEDEAARTELIDQLRALLEARRAAEEAAAPEPEAPGAQLLNALAQRTGTLAREFVEASRTLIDVSGAFTWFTDQMGTSDGRAAWVGAVGKTLLVLAAAGAVLWLVRRGLARVRRSVAARTSRRWSARLTIAAVRAVVDLIAIAAFAVAANVVLPFTDPTDPTRIIVTAVVGAIAVIWGVLAVIAPAVAVDRADMRPVPVSDETAHYVVIWVRRFATVGAVGYFAIGAALALGAAPAVGAALYKLLGLIVTAMAVVLILQIRRGVSDAIAGGEGASRARLADIWHILAVLYVVGLYTVWALGLRGGFAHITRATVLTALIIVLARLAIVGAARLLDRGLAVGGELRRQFPALEARANRYAAVISVTVRGVTWLVALVAMAEAWGINVVDWLATPAALAVIGGLVRTALIVGVAFAVLEVAGTLIERYMMRGNETPGSLSARSRTVLPLLRNVLRVVVGTIVVLVLLSEVGIDIGPLLAGAGVVGLAVGFGAQKLVQDVITGLFILIEDTIHVGEVVRAGGHVGLVEGVTIRTIRLRDLTGTVHTIPFNEVTTIENLTKDFSFAVMEVGVAYREDTDEVVEVLKAVAEDLRGDAAFAGDILEPMEVLGVDAFADSAVVIKVRMKTRPLRQWAVKREYNRRMKKAFDERGIEIPFPHQTIYFGTDKSGHAPPAYVSVTGVEAGASNAGGIGQKDDA